MKWKSHEIPSDMQSGDSCELTGDGWRRAGAGDEDARTGTGPSDANDRSKAGISTHEQSAGKCKGRAVHAGASGEDCRRSESHVAANGSGDSCLQGTAATIGALSKSDGGLHRR